MLAVAALFRVDGLTHWDSWDYASQAISGHSSDLLLGRWWFLALMRSAWLAGRHVFALRPLEGFLAMQLVCALSAAGAVVAGMAWTRRLSGSVTGELVFAAFAITSPLFGRYAAAVMTEAPTLLVISLAFLAWEKALEARTLRRAQAWALAAGLLLGAMISMREQAVTLLAWPLVSCVIDRPAHRGRLLLVGAGGAALALGVGVLGAWLWHPWVEVSFWERISLWIRSMRAERELHPPRLAANLGWIWTFMLTAGSCATLLALPAILWVALAHRRRLPGVLIAVTPYFLTLAINHDLSVNSRFILPGFWLIAPVVAAFVAAVLAWVRRWARPLVAGVLVAVLSGQLYFGYRGAESYHFRSARQREESLRVMVDLPRTAVVIPGPSTPVAYYLNRLGYKRFEVVGSGWAWPGDALGRQIHTFVRDRRAVYAYMDSAAWTNGTRPCDEWETLKKTASRYAWDVRHWPLVRLRLSDDIRPETASTAPQRLPERSGPSP
jgi:hypothetical protein